MAVTRHFVVCQPPINLAEEEEEEPEPAAQEEEEEEEGVARNWRSKQGTLVPAHEDNNTKQLLQKVGL